MLETERCRLSKLQSTDYEDIKKIYIDEKVRKYLGGTVDEERCKIKFQDMINANSDSFYWIIRQIEKKQFIGLVSLDLHHDGKSTEISYQLMPEWWGKGYGTEIAERVIKYGFEELGLTRIVAETQTANKSSCRLLEGVGMKFQETTERFGALQSIYYIENTNRLKGRL